MWVSAEGCSSQRSMPLRNLLAPRGEGRELDSV